MDVTAMDQLEFHFQKVIEHFGKVKILSCPKIKHIKVLLYLLLYVVLMEEYTVRVF
jgi:hypothetical protein